MLCGSQYLCMGPVTKVGLKEGCSEIHTSKERPVQFVSVFSSHTVFNAFQDRGSIFLFSFVLLYTYHVCKASSNQRIKG